MKKIILLLSFILTCFAACKKEINKTGTVRLGCMGTFLEINRTPFLVCNGHVLEEFDSGDEVKVNYKRIDNCEKQTGFYYHCLLNEVYVGWIEILKVK